jgi:ABC-type uncharacterized transport system substrate-binding protein
MREAKVMKMVLGIGLMILVCGTVGWAKKKVLIIDSYHVGYPWSDGIVQGAEKVLGDKVEVKVVHMDTKRNPAEAAKKAAGEKVKQDIEAWKPDAVIAADDNSAQYVIVPFYKDKDLPFVFCGINWDASIYGFPCKNVTGMCEVSLINPLLDNLKKFAKGKRIGFLGADNETNHKEAEYLNKMFNVEFSAQKFVKTFDEWKTAYKELQDKADILFFINYAGITGWNDADAKKFILENTKIPGGSSFDFMAPYVLITYAKLAEEQGEWSAGAVLKILEGKSPRDIPVTTNKKGQLYVNMPLAGKLGVKFPLDTLKAAKIVKD